MTSQDELRQQRQEKDDFFKRNSRSPLTDEQKPDFNHLNYYDYNPDLDLTVVVVPFEEQALVPVHTTTNEIRNYRRYGEFTFAVDGEQARLTIYETPHGFFLPFIDANAGKETYPAGRYLDLEPGEDNVFYIDFNQAYNPLCAYNDRWNCPITPAENRLKVAVRAGEKIPTGKWVEKS